MDFVGHRKAIEVVRFNPHLFVKSGSKSKENHGCLALGSKDRSLSIWLTNHKRPLVVVHDLFKDSILDLSWSKGGYELLICSTDGSMAYVSFTTKELGLRLSKQALDDLYLRTYGFKRAEVKNIADTSMVLIENPEMLKLHPSVSETNPSATTGVEISNSSSAVSGGVVSTSSKAPAKSTVLKQVETRTKDGKRRITPITLTTEPLPSSHLPLPFTSFSNSSPKQARVVSASSAVALGGATPDRSDKGEGGVSKKSASGSEHSTPKSCGDYFPEAEEGGTPPKPISFEALSPKALQDPLLSSKNPGGSGIGRSASSPSLKSTTAATKLGRKRSNEELVAASSETIALPKAKKFKRKGIHSLVVGGASAAVHSPVRTSTPQKHAASSSGLGTATDRHHSRVTSGLLAQLPVPKVESNFSVVVLESEGRRSREGEGPGSAVLEVENSPDHTHCTVSYGSNNECMGGVGGGGVAGSKVTSWSATLPSPCLLAAASKVVTVTACQDKSVSFLSTQTGRTLIAQLSLPETCYSLRAESHYVMATLCSGHVTVWDARRLKSVVRHAPFSHLLSGMKQPPDEIVLTKDGLPVIKVGSTCFVFNTNMEAWMNLGSSKEVSEIGGTPDFNFGDAPRTSDCGDGGVKVTSSLEYLQRSLLSGDGGDAALNEDGCPRQHNRSDSVGAMLRQVHSRGISGLGVRSKGGPSGGDGEGLLQASASTLTYLESQISRSSYLASPGEYRKWCRAYVQYLVRNGMEDRLREFCGQFSAPVSALPPSTTTTTTTTTTSLGGPILGGPGELVLGFTRVEMLREFMSMVAKNHKLQRLYSELKETVDRQGGAGAAGQLT